MNSLDNMRKRFNFNGGIKQQNRMIEDKLKSLKKALLYSYQAATAILEDGREFRCLINPDKLKDDYDDKIISIPFEDVCIGKIVETIDEQTEETVKIKETVSNNIQEIGMKSGDVFEWKENGSFWLVYLQRLEEYAYFRAEIRRCDYETKIGDNNYKIYLKGPTTDRMIWHTKREISWNDLNYNFIMYITKNEETLNFCHRFAKININNKPYEIQAIDDTSVKGIIQVALKEDFSNEVEEAEKQRQKDNPPTPTSNNIKGKLIVYPYDRLTYTIEGLEGGIWSVNNEKIKILSQNEDSVNLEVRTGKSGNFRLTYTTNQEVTYLDIEIKSL